MIETSTRRYEEVTEAKSGGVAYTPKLLADFVAARMLEVSDLPKDGSRIRVLDPAVGDGELLLSLLGHMPALRLQDVEVHGFETDSFALGQATARLHERFPSAALRLKHGSFLDFILERTSSADNLFGANDAEPFHLIIANPPYVRTQIMGAEQAQLLAQQFGLGGRVDLYHAFLLGIARVLGPGGTCGVIVSNRFMTTKSGASVRSALRESFAILHVWDFGDTKLFDAAVLPAVLLVHGKNGNGANRPRFTSIYETAQNTTGGASDPVAAVLNEGAIRLSDGRKFEVRHGSLDTRGPLDGVWRIATEIGDNWLKTVQENTWGTFRTIGKIRVGVKTCADSVFIRDDWDDLPSALRPELLRPLITHHVARRFKASTPDKPRRIVYPHESVGGSRVPSDLAKHPRAEAYFDSHRKTLESRRYVIDGGRKWYEIWVPQDPAAWDAPKLVFRDISEEPIFWIDHDGSVVNGDCYWLAPDRPRDERLLWLGVAVGNSTFAEAFYDHRFHNKLYSGRRRFMTQYVEQFPLPNPDSDLGRIIITMAKALYDVIETPVAREMEIELNRLVWKAFGLPVEKVNG